MSQELENLSALVDGEYIASSSSSIHVLDAVKNDADFYLSVKNL